MITDITERKETERQLRESKERLQTIFNIANAGFTITDKTGKYTMFNAWFRNELGYTEEELKGLSGMDITHAEDFDECRIQFDKLASGEIDRCRIEKRYIRKDGTFFWADLSVSVIKDELGNIESIIGMVTDITHLKNTESEMIQSKNQLQATLEAIPDLLFEVDLDGLVLNYHSHHRNIIDSTIVNLIGKKISESISVEAANICLSALQEANTNGFSEGKQIFVSFPDSQYWFELSISKKPDSNLKEPRFVALARNITARKSIEASLIESENRYHGLVENSPINIHDIDLNGKFISMNKKGLDMLDLENE